MNRVLNVDRAEHLKRCINKHLEDECSLNRSWELCKSNKTGCGLFATRDIEPNEIIVFDKPLLLAPTGNSNEPIVCVVCYNKIDFINLCPENCGLPLCEGSSSCAILHQTECQLMQKWLPKNPNKISFVKLKALLVTRVQFLSKDAREFLAFMQKNFSNKNDEIFFADEFDSFPQDQQLWDCFRQTAALINTNALKILIKSNGDKSVSIRGVYPITGLMNHNCVPNTRRDVDKHFLNKISAARKIRKGEEIFTSYSQLLWATNSRRIQLAVTKQFLCNCDRCNDPSEYLTNMLAIRCLDKQCDGLVLPIIPINFKSAWKCGRCETVYNSNKILQIQEIVASMVKNFLRTSYTFDELLAFMDTKLKNIIPDCNQFAIETKLEGIWNFKSIAQKEDKVNYCNNLNVIKVFCESILQALNMLQAGECSIKGFVAFTLYHCRTKLRELNELMPTEDDDSDEVLLNTAKIILADNVGAPNGIPFQ